MARYHYWQFLVNQEGQPINNAEIQIYLAGTDQPAYVYQSEYGDDGIETIPQVYTNKAGYFEFWLGDEEESRGYPIGEKFKIRWYREGIASGSIDWVDIFPGFAPVNENDPDSEFRNKLVSNALAYEWTNHANWDVNVDGFPLHGIDEVDPTSTTTAKNKVLSNHLAYQWTEHMKDSNDHLNLDVNVSGILSGGGTLTESITIVLNNEDIDHNYVSQLQGGTLGEKYHLTQSQHSNLTDGDPEFDQVHINEDPILPDHAVRKDYVDDLVQGMFWQNSVIDFYNPESDGFPTDPNDGDRYISESTYYEDEIEWYENYIYEYDGQRLIWVETEPQQGYTLLVEEELRHYHYNGTKWIKFWAGFAWYKVSSDTTLINRCGYLVDTSSNAITLTFPSSPSLGARIDILDYIMNSENNNITLNGNGNNIEEQSEFIVDINGAGLQFVYTDDSDIGWKMINEIYSEDALTKIYEEYHEITDTDSGWTEDGGSYFINITHERGTSWPDVTVYDYNDRIIVTPNKIKSVDSENIKLWFDSATHIQVKLS